MCEQCVAEGRMTQEDLDRIDAQRSQVSSAVISGDPAEFLARLLGGGAPVDPEAQALAELDKTVQRALGIHRDKLTKLTETSSELGDILKLDSAVKIHLLAELEARLLMFGESPRAIAYALAVVIHRYDELLDAWGTLYAKAAIGDDDTIDLDAAQTAEARAAVTKATKPAENPTGMYL